MTINSEWFSAVSDLALIIEVTTDELPVFQKITSHNAHPDTKFVNVSLHYMSFPFRVVGGGLFISRPPRLPK